MKTFTWNQGDENTVVVTWQSGDVALSITVAALVPEGEQYPTAYSVGIVGMIGEDEIVMNRRSYGAIGQPNSGAFASCGLLLDGPSLTAVKNIVFVVADRTI